MEDNAVTEALYAQALADLSVKVDRIDETLRGNGRQGLVTQVTLIQSRVDALDGFVRELHAFRRWILLGVLSLFGSLAWQVIEATLTRQ